MVAKNEDLNKTKLEGALGYLHHVGTQIKEGKLKDLAELQEKINVDAERLSSTLSGYLTEELHIAGLQSGFMED